MSNTVLKILSNREKYYRFIKYIKEHTLSKEEHTVLQDYDDWFVDNALKDNIDFSLFPMWFSTIKHPVFNKDKQEIYRRIFDDVSMLPMPDEKDIDNIVKHYINRDYATQIADIASEIAEGEGGIDDLDQIGDILLRRDDELGRVNELENMIATEDADTIADYISGKTGLQWRLPELNMMLGPAKRGDLMVFAARPDGGKTTMLASEATHMATQLPEEQNVLWFNNEEAGEKVRAAIICASLGCSREDYVANPHDCVSDYDKLMGRKQKIIVIDRATIDVHTITKFLRNYNPGLIIVDQLWKVHGFEKQATGEVQRQQFLFNQAREWAKEYAPLATVHQADASAEGELWINMAQLYGVKTAAQGEADAIIGIGRSHEMGKEDVRGLWASKNKMGGDPAHRNSRFEVVIKPDIVRYEGTF